MASHTSDSQRRSAPKSSESTVQVIVEQALSAAACRIFRGKRTARWPEMPRALYPGTEFHRSKLCSMA